MRHRNIAKTLTVLFIVITFLPQITFAAWWNPISWNIWNILRPISKTQQAQTALIRSATATPDTIVSNKENKKDVKKDLLNNEVKKQVNDFVQKKVSSASTSSSTKQTIFITPSGAMLDVNGKVLNQTEIDAQNAAQEASNKTQLDAIRKQQIIDAAAALKARQDAANIVAANAKVLATNVLNKEYKLKINALQAQLIEANSLEDSSGIKSAEILRFYGNSQGTQFPDFVDTDFKKLVVKNIYIKLDAVNPVGRGTSYVVAFLREQTSALSIQIAQLWNELERKLLELQD